MHFANCVILELPEDGDSTKTQQSGHAPRSEPEVKNGRSSAKDQIQDQRSKLERLRFRKTQEKVS